MLASFEKVLKETFELSSSSWSSSFGAFGCQHIVTYRLAAGSWSAQSPHNSPEPTMGGKKKKSKGKMLTNPVYGATELTVRAAPQLN